MSEIGVIREVEVGWKEEARGEGSEFGEGGQLSS